MKVISLLNHKGGVGKTTLCTNLGTGILLNDDPQNILLVDADPQGSLRDWHNARTIEPTNDSIQIVGADRRSTLLGLPHLFTPDYMLIDTPGDTKDVIGAALQMSDLAIIPLRPSPYDIWASAETIDLVRSANSINPKLKMMMVINQAIPNTRIHKEVRELLNEYTDFYICQTHICHRISFARTASEGQTVFESTDNPAMGEIANVTDEILDFLWGRVDAVNYA